jgi:putative ATPase
MAINKAQHLVKATGDLPVPLTIRNAPTQLMKDLDYGKEYAYAHDYEGHFSNMEFLPEKIQGALLYEPGANPTEQRIREYLRQCWKEKYGY